MRGGQDRVETFRARTEPLKKGSRGYNLTHSLYGPFLTLKSASSKGRAWSSPVAQALQFCQEWDVRYYLFPQTPKDHMPLDDILVMPRSKYKPT